MKRMSIIGLTLLATIAVSAITISSASAALPEFKFTKLVHFTSESLLPLQPTLRSTILGAERNISCKMSKSTGELEGFKQVGKILVDYTECKEESHPANTCTTVGRPTGLIITKDMGGLIGYVVPNGAAKKLVGLLLKPESGKFAEFTCTGEAEKVTIEGCTIGKLIPVNVLSNRGSLVFIENTAKTGQEFTELEDMKGKCSLTTHAGFFELGEGPSWLMDSEGVTLSEPIELKA